MNIPLPSDSDLAALARQVDEQLFALQSVSANLVMRGESDPARTLPDAPDQRAVLEKAADEPFETFWQKYKRHARRDLCLPGGMLYEQWHKWHDIESKTAVRSAYLCLAAMGIPTASLAPAAVAASVFLLNVVIKIGIEAVCEDCAAEEKPKELDPRLLRGHFELNRMVRFKRSKMESVEEGGSGDFLAGELAETVAAGEVASMELAEPPAEDTTLYTLWYGTNRQPVDSADHSKGYLPERAQEVSYGTCKVSIPESHKFGSIGSSWLRRLITFTDDRLRLVSTTAAAAADFWTSLRTSLDECEPDDRQALLFIHGFNVSFEEAAIRAAQIGCDLKAPGVTSFFSWPSKGNTGEYAADEASIEASEGAIADFVCRLAEEAGARRVHVIAHSMGNRGLLRAMQRIFGDAERRAGVKLGQVFLAAPDLDAGLFRDLAYVYPQLSQRTTLYVSRADKAVGLSTWLHGAPRAGFIPPVTVVNGVDTIEVPDFDLDILGHGYYAGAAGVLHDMFDLLRRDAPPDDRQRIEKQQPAGGAPYWRIVR
ncbi:MAG: alpha/beta fold hydrolase [FCB group bacterium]|jgi:esterase/lipase superfamily enzyme|nr:alpha/beta fold hydrolase [FCB group bacterium]